VRIAVKTPGEEELLREFEITDDIRKDGKAKVIEYSNGWQPYDQRLYIPFEPTIRSVREIEVQNAKVRKENARLTDENAKRTIAPRPCVFVLSPINVLVPIGIIDSWVADAKPNQPIGAELELDNEVLIEDRIEAISAKIHGSQLSLREDGTLLWSGSVIATLKRKKGMLSLATADNRSNIGDFHIPDLISTLFELNILSLPAQRGKRKR
jgi:hypothetical protein